jgi:hypothetical protein
MTKPKKSLINRRGYFRDMKPIDYVLSVVGLCIGTVAALFPWHVYLNPQSYGPPEMTFSRSGVIPASEVAAQSRGTPIFNVDTSRYVILDTSNDGVDGVVTGEIDPDSRAISDPDQPFPGNGRPFQVYAVDASRALIGDVDGVYLVARNERLPDGTMVKTIAHDERGWYIVTSNERLLRPE